MADKKIFYLIIPIAILIILIGIYYFKTYLLQKEISKLSLDNIIIEDNKIDLASLTLGQKISQMVIVRGDEEDLRFNRLNAGGIFLDRQKSEKDYKDLISRYQKDSKIKLLVSTDLEGAWTPFHNPKPNQVFPPFSEIKTADEAQEIGLKHGKLLKEIGFNLNFAPVAEYSDKVYGGRTFLGSKEEIADKVAAYIRGLQKNVLGTCKHYPGKSMEKNLHYFSDKQEISKEDLSLFKVCLDNNISAIMVSHQIATGEADSKEKPSSVSKEVISTIDSPVLVIADEINMKGLKKFYSDKTKLYIDLINSGENLILDFDLDSSKMHKLIKNLEREAELGNIDKQKIDESVKKILIIKGYEVK